MTPNDATEVLPRPPTKKRSQATPSGSVTSPSPPPRAQQAGKAFAEGLKRPFTAAFETYGKFAGKPTEKGLSTASDFGTGLLSGLGYDLPRPKRDPDPNADQGPGSLSAATPSLDGGSKLPSPPRLAGQYGNKSVFAGQDRSGTPAFSDDPNDPRLIGEGPEAGQADRMAEIAGAPTMAERLPVLKRRDQYQREVESANRSRKLGDRNMRANEIKRLLGVGLNRVDDITPKTEAEQSSRALAAELVDNVRGRGAEQDFARAEAKRPLPPPPRYSVRSDGQLSLVKGALARPVRDSSGRAFKAATPKDGAKLEEARRKEYFSLLEALMPGADELRWADDPNELIQGRAALAAELMRESTPGFEIPELGNSENPSFQGDLPQDGETRRDTEGRWWARLGDVLYAAAAPMPE